MLFYYSFVVPNATPTFVFCVFTFSFSQLKVSVKLFRWLLSDSTFLKYCTSLVFMFFRLAWYSFLVCQTLRIRRISFSFAMAAFLGCSWRVVGVFLAGGSFSFSYPTFPQSFIGFVALWLF